MARHETSASPASDEATTDVEHHTRSESASVDAPIREYRGTGIIWSAVALIVAVALFVVIALQNMQDVEFEVLWFDLSTPLSLIVAITFGLALVTGEVIGFVWRRRRRTRLREREELRRLRKRSR